MNLSETCAFDNKIFATALSLCALPLDTVGLSSCKFFRSCTAVRYLNMFSHRLGSLHKRSAILRTDQIQLDYIT